MDGSARSRDAARKFLETVDARGGTELAAGFLAAAKLLGNDGGDVFVLTDGQVSGTEVILAKARAAGIRIHCLGIGSASQDRFLTLLARETGGVSRFLTARERVDMAAVELFASIGSPVARGIRIESDEVSFAPEPPPAIFTGNPLVLFGETAGKADVKVQLAWEGGKLEVPVKLAKSGEAETVALLQGSRLITDMEARLDTEPSAGAAGKRESDRQTKALEKLSAKYGLASRAMSLVAVVKRKGDKPGDVPKTMVVPVGMPQDTAFGAYFSGSTLHESAGRYSPPHVRMAQPLACMGSPVRAVKAAKSSIRQSLPADGMSPDQSTEDILLRIAGRIEPDGGMPGKDDEERWVATATALFGFLAEGHTAKSGAFRAHVKKLLAFLKAFSITATDERKRQLVELAENGTSLSGDWLERARVLVEKSQPDAPAFWKEAERAMRLLQATTSKSKR